MTQLYRVPKPCLILRFKRLLLLCWSLLYFRVLLSYSGNLVPLNEFYWSVFNHIFTHLLFFVYSGIFFEHQYDNFFLSVVRIFQCFSCPLLFVLCVQIFYTLNEHSIFNFQGTRDFFASHSLLLATTYLSNTILSY